MNRRDFSQALAATSLSAVLPCALSQTDTYPNRPIEMIVGYGPGGVTDVLMRAIAQPLSRILGQPVIIMNKPGAGGTLGPGTMAMRDKPDGYTLAFIAMAVGLQPLMQKTSWDPLKDFTYISMLTDFTIGITVRADSPFKSLSELLAYAKANPGKVTYAALGPGSAMHLGMERIAQQAGVKFTYVPYTRPTDIVQAILGGHVMVQVDATSWAEHVNIGTMRLLALATEERSKKWPAAPTLKESGFDFTIGGPFGVAGPAGMSPAIIHKLDEALAESLKDPGVIDAFDRYDMRMNYLDSAHYRKYMEERLKAEDPVIKALGLARPA